MFKLLLLPKIATPCASIFCYSSAYLQPSSPLFPRLYSHGCCPVLWADLQKTYFRHTVSLCLFFSHQVRCILLTWYRSTRCFPILTRAEATFWHQHLVGIFFLPPSLLVSGLFSCPWVRHLLLLILVDILSPFLVGNYYCPCSWYCGWSAASSAPNPSTLAGLHNCFQPLVGSPVCSNSWSASLFTPPCPGSFPRKVSGPSRGSSYKGQVPYPMGDLGSWTSPYTSSSHHNRGLFLQAMSDGLVGSHHWESPW